MSTRSENDAAFYGLQSTALEGCFEFEVTEQLSRMDRRLYGGTAIGVSVAAAEAVSGRSPLWMTTQFVSTVQTGAVMTLRAEILAPGRRTQQLRVTGLAPDGTVVFASLGATGTHKAEGMAGTFETMPSVTSPDDSQSWTSVFEGMMPAELRARIAERAAADPDGAAARRGHAGISELRMATALDDEAASDSDRVFVWARRTDGRLITPALAAYIADMVPMAVARAAGKFAGGTSLDNTIRFSGFDDTEWMLLDLRPHFAAGGYGHGDGRMWSPDGRLLAIASQTAVMREFDLLNPPWDKAEGEQLSAE